MKVLTVIGACPQFIKPAPVSRALQRAGIQEIIVHTGQHYDHNMSAVFSQELEISEPDINLGVGSGPHGQQTGRMLMALENVRQEKSPDWLIVYGVTNSTLAGSLAAAKLNIPIAHVEAGLHSYNKKMPEKSIVSSPITYQLCCYALPRQPWKTSGQKESKIQTLQAASRSFGRPTSGRRRQQRCRQT